MTKYKPGDRVISLRWPPNGAGVIVKAAPIRALVRWDGLKEDTRARTADIRPETAEDVARRGHKQTMQTWRDRQPKVTHVAINIPGMCWSPDGARLHGVLRTPETMRAAAAELLQLADWFAEKPVEP